MGYDLPQPDIATIETVLEARLPHLPRQDIEPLGTGWAFWAFRAGETVLRFPRDAEFTQTLRVEERVMHELAPTLPLPVAAIEVHEGGPGGLPFTSHRLVPGVQVRALERPLASNAGEVLGRFIRAMHDFPVERAVELGLPYQSPQDARERWRRLLEERIVPEVLPLVSKEARAHVTARFEAFLDDDSNFDRQPVVSHGDLDDWNTLADPATGEFTGVVDWGDIAIGDPASEFTISLYGGFGPKGLKLPTLARGYGISEAELERMRPRCAFAAYCWPLHEIIYCQESRNEAGLQEAIEFLYETVRTHART